MNDDSLLNATFFLLAATAIGVKWYTWGLKAEASDPVGRSFQKRYLLVFWSFKMADWLQGPYFYDVYASKVFDGQPIAPNDVGRLFLCGFVSSMVFGTVAGSFVDSMGRKKGCIAFVVLYLASAFSTFADRYELLMLGRVAGGIATSLLFSAPEAWMCSEAVKQNVGNLIGNTFGWAYTGDAIVAITAGQVASYVAGISGPTAPFAASACFLLIGLGLVLSQWEENFGTDAGGKGSSLMKTWGGALGAIFTDPKVLLVGIANCTYEGGMFLFVLVWAPLLSSASVTKDTFPYGKAFACFMASCMIGSSMLGPLGDMVKGSASGIAGPLGYVMAAGSASLGVAAYMGTASGVLTLLVCFLVFECSVGMYFPAIGDLRSGCIPDAHRSTVMNLFRVPLNAIVIFGSLSIEQLGPDGVIRCAAVSVAVASCALIALCTVMGKGKKPDGKKKK